MSYLLDIARQKRKLDTQFFKKGILIAILSGMTYGLYTAFITYAMSKGIWQDWYGNNSAGLSTFITIFVLGALASGINDIVSALWAIVVAICKGKFGDFIRCLKTKPAAIMIVCALIGGPIASTAYIIALQTAGSIIIPITALCPALGAILGRIIFKQPLNARMILGIAICAFATILIGSIGMESDTKNGILFGCIIAFIAALAWSIEGCIAGFGTVVIDYEIGIVIRQLTSGLTNIIILIPIMCVIAGNVAIAPELISTAFTSAPAMIFFVVSSFFALFAYSLWYKGNSMCGTALGMACNGAYSFWGPFFCWLILGIIFKQDGWALHPIAWVAAIIMVIGIFLIAINPFKLLKTRKNDEIEIKECAISKQIQNLKNYNGILLPLNYAILQCFTKTEEADASMIYNSLYDRYNRFKHFSINAITESLMTAKANNLLEETRIISDDNEIKVYYQATTDGYRMINKFIN